MQKVWKKVLSLGLALAVCLGITATLCTATNWGVSADAAEGSYYASITASGGTALLGQVHDLITSTHKKYASYSDCRDYGPVTDPGLDGSGVLEFYTHETIATFSGTVGTWNREHVWAQSLSNGLWGTTGGGSDLHHIRPSEASLNSDRGNQRYGNVTNGSPLYSKKVGGANSQVGGYSNGSTFEPLANVKGDVARIVMYVYTHYNTYTNSIFGGYAKTNGSGGSFGTLTFTKIISASNESAAIKILLDWNKSDPVDEIERTRNEVAYGIQGNRNPFIDHPEYADAIWGDGNIGGGDIGGGDIGGGDVGGELPDVGEVTPDDFRAAVAGIVTDGTMQEFFASLNYAIAAYKALSAEDKNEVTAEAETLQVAIDAYNHAAGSYNADSKNANDAALKGAGGFFEWINDFLKATWQSWGN